MFEFLFELGLGAVIVYYTITRYTHIKVFLFDTISGISFLGKWVRRKDVEIKYENIINGAINEFNSGFESKIISNCQVKWINKGTERSYFENDKAIICLKFDPKDQDLNFFNATYTFTKTALLPNTRNFVKNFSQKAIDLNLTKIFIKNYNRNALRIFNQHYRSEEQEVKDCFIRFEETEKRGLFTNLLIPELHYLGETLATETPTDKIEKEIEDFFIWFYELATRGKEERTNLNFKSEHLKVGVILVANIDTFNAYGIDAYTKWADKYASEHYGAVYLLARGNTHALILKKIVTELTNNKGFDQINKKVTLQKTDESGESIEISFYCLKPNLSKVQFNAWEKIKSAFNDSKIINGIVSSVNENGLSINIHGIDIFVAKEKLSSKTLPDIRKFFKSEQELILNIESYNEDECLLSLNNIGTDTDPVILIEATLKDNQEITVVVNSVQFDKEGKERGLNTYCKSLKKKVFIPKKYCSFSRFIRLESSFEKGQELCILLHGYSMEYANFYGEIKGLINPLTKFQQFQENHKYEATIQDISDNYITAEMIPGLECRIYRPELSWDNNKNPENFKIGEKTEVVIIKSDTNRYQLLGSIKRVQRSDKEEFYKANINSVLSASVIKVYPGIGLKFKLIESGNIGFVYVRELMWGFCSDIEKSFPLNSTISVIPIDFDYQNNEIQYSVKACFKNDYEEVVDFMVIGKEYKGKVLKHFPDIARIQIQLNGHTVQGYIHKSEISNIAFVDDEDIKRYLPINSEFNFELKRRDNKNKIIEVSRKNIVSSDFSDLEFGDVLEVTIVKKDSKGAYFYENEMEGIISEKFDSVQIGSKIEVFLINSKGEFSL